MEVRLLGKDGDGGEEPKIQRGIAEVNEVWEGEDEKRGGKQPPKYCTSFGGATFQLPARDSKAFKERLPFRVPSRAISDAWASGEKKPLSASGLWKYTESYLRTTLDLEDAFEVKILCLAVFQTWLRKVLDWAFNIDLGGPFGAGKSTVLETLGEICYHAVLGNPSAAVTARYNEIFDITWFIDEYDKIKLADEGIIDTFIRQGYRRGVRIYRFNSETQQTDSFDPFGPKFLSYHTDIEAALKQRSITHLKMDVSEDFRLPVVNFVRASVSQRIFDEFFIWYMENIASLSQGGPDGPDRPDSEGSMGGLTVRQILGAALSKGTQGSGDSNDILQILLSEGEPKGISLSESVGETPSTTGSIGSIESTARQRIFEVVTSNLTGDERALLVNLKGRGAELGFLAILIARLLRIDLVKELRDALEVKAQEEEEPEFNPKEIVRDMLARLHYDQDKQEIRQAEVFEVAR